MGTGWWSESKKLVRNTACWKSALRKCHKQGKEKEGTVCCLRLKELKMESACWKSGTWLAFSKWGRLNFPTTSNIRTTFKNNIPPPYRILTSSFPLVWKTEEGCILLLSLQKQSKITRNTTQLAYSYIFQKACKTKVNYTENSSWLTRWITMLLFLIVATQWQNSETRYCLSSRFLIHGEGTKGLFEYHRCKKCYLSFFRKEYHTLNTGE